MTTAQGSDQPKGPLVPGGPIAGMQFWRLSWRILRARARLMIPAALVLGAISAGAQMWLIIRAAGSVRAAVDADMNLAAILTPLMKGGSHSGQLLLFGVLGGFLVTSLIIPSVANSGLVAVVNDAINDSHRAGRAYIRSGARALPSVIGAQVIQTVVALGPVVVVYVEVIAQGRVNTKLGSAIDLFIGLPLAVLALYLTIGWYFTPQTVVIEGVKPIAAMKASAALTRRSRLRVISILLATLLVTGFISLAVATPISWIATLNGGSAAGPTLGSQLVSEFITQWAQQAVTIIASASVLTLLYTDLKRRSEGAQYL